MAFFITEKKCPALQFTNLYQELFLTSKLTGQFRQACKTNNNESLQRVSY